MTEHSTRSFVAGAIGGLVVGALVSVAAVSVATSDDDTPRPATTSTSESDPADGASRDRPTGAAADPMLSVEDNQLVDAEGRRHVMVGATLYALPFYLDDGWVDWSVMVESRATAEQIDQILGRMAEAGLNTVRIPVGTEAWQKHVYSLSADEWLDRLAVVTEAAAEHDMHVVITWWDALSWGAEWPRRHDESFRFMRAVHDRLAEFDNVVVEPMNEPHHITWSEWRTAVESTIRFWRNELGFDGILILDTIDWSWSFDPSAAEHMIAVDRELLGDANLMFGIHRYANTSECFCGDEAAEWDREVGRWIDDMPIVVTEVGNSNEAHPPQQQWLEEFMHTLTTTATDDGLNGVIAFLWRWQDANTMTEADGTTPTPFGAFMIDALAPLTTTPTEPAERNLDGE